MELVGFDKLSVLLGLAKAETEYADLEVIKESVTAAFEDYTHRIFDEDKYIHTDILGSLPTKMIMLPAIPVTNVSSVLLDGVPVTDFEITVFGLRLGSKVINTSITVEYTGGLDSVPRNLERAALLQTAYEYQNKNSIGIEVVSTEGGSTVKPELGLLKEVKTLLNHVKHPFPFF